MIIKLDFLIIKGEEIRRRYYILCEKEKERVGRGRAEYAGILVGGQLFCVRIQPKCDSEGHRCIQRRDIDCKLERIPGGYIQDAGKIERYLFCERQKACGHA